ncbi:hypothetical protein ABMB68_004615 [Bradyrhizobium sp. RT4a]
MVVFISLPVFLAGSCQFEVLFEPGPRRALQSFFWMRASSCLIFSTNSGQIFEICMLSDNGTASD